MVQSPPDDPHRLRNLAIVAHINAGKTTLCERILVASGRQRYFGEVDAGTAAMDWLREEQDRGISIEAAVTHVEWQGYRIQIVDTPGHVDFGAEVERSLRVVDGAIVVIDAVRGVESQTEAVWRRLDALSIPRLIFVNKLDRATASLERAMATIRARLCEHAVLVDMPVSESSEVGFRCIDLFEPTVESELGPRDRQAVADERARLIERLGEVDDDILAAYVADRPVSAAELRVATRRATSAGAAVPVLCGSALRDVGVRRLLDGVLAFLPGPDRHPSAGLADGSATSSPLGALVFAEGPRTIDDLETMLARVFLGEVGVGDEVETQRGDACRVDALFDVHADQLLAQERATMGRIVAVRTSPPVRLGDTLRGRSSDIVLEPPSFAAPVLARALEPDRSENRSLVEDATRQLAAADPTLAVLVDEATGDLLIAGMGELHLDVFRERLARRLGDRFAMGPLRVLRRWVPMQSGLGRSRVERVLEGQPGASHPTTAVAFAEVLVEPSSSPGLGLRWAVAPGVTAILEAAAPEIRAEILIAIESLVRRGQGGDAFADLVVEVRQLVAEPMSAPVLTLLLEAVGQALMEAMGAARPQHQEPRVFISVELPHDAVRPVLADLRSRDAEIAEIGGDSEHALLLAYLPLAKVLGWTTQLRSRTRGQGAHTMMPAGWVELR